MARVAPTSNIFVTGPGSQGLEPVWAHRFLFTIDTSPVDGGSGKPPSDIECSVKSLTPGMKQVTTDVYRVLNRWVPYPTHKDNSTQPLQLVLNVHSSKPGGVNPQAFTFFSKWMDLVYNDATDEVGILYATSDVGQPSAIGGKATLRVFGPDNDTVIVKVSYDNIWPFAMGIQAVDRDTEAVLQYQMSFNAVDITFDWMPKEG